MKNLFYKLVICVGLQLWQVGAPGAQMLDPRAEVTISGIALGDPSLALKSLGAPALTVIDKTEGLNIYREKQTKLVCFRGRLVSVSGNTLEQRGVLALQIGMTRDRVERCLSRLGPSKGSAEWTPINLLPIWPLDLSYHENSCKWLVAGTNEKLNYVLVCYWEAGRLIRTQLGDGRAFWSPPNDAMRRRLLEF